MKSDKGSVVIIVALCVTLFCAFTALTVDVGFAVYTKRKLQASADFAALSGVSKVSTDPLSRFEASVFSRQVGSLNGISPTELAPDDSVLVGTWNFDQKVFSESESNINAVRVALSRTIPTYFAALIGVRTLNITVVSVAVKGGAKSSTCMIPFAVTDDLLAGAGYEEIVTLNTESPGNWGKIQISPEKLTRKEFIDAMTYGFCGITPGVGDETPTDTGFSGVDDGFKSRMDTNPFAVMPVVDSFYNGNSETLVIKGFIYVKLLSSRKSGANWEGQFILLDQIINGSVGGTDDSPYGQARILVQ